MPVNVKVVGPEDKHEFHFALNLKSIFEESLPHKAKGEISIISNVQLMGQNPRDVDIIVIGNLEGVSYELITNTRSVPTKFKKRRIWVNSFCFTFETKEHDSQGVEMRGTSLVVKYGNKIRDVTSQSEGQKYSLLNYLNSVAPTTRVWICNFIWLQNLSLLAVNKMTGCIPHNILPNMFNLQHLFQTALLQSPPVKTSEKYCYISSLHLRSGGSTDEAFKIINDVLTGPKQAAGYLTRRNVERIVGKEIVIPDDLLNALGEKLIIISGRAGTGKTVKMLRMGCELSSEKGRRCLFLTYNRALVNDIMRTLFFANIPTDFDQGCVEIMTIHEFTRKLGIALGLITSKEYSPQKHLVLCSEISECIESQVITHEDIINLMKERHELACWDHIFIDEAQDFGEEEKLLLFKFFGYSKLVIADGVDQFIRRTSKVNWGKNIYVVKSTEKRSLRQKKNLATFVNDYAKAMDLKWHVDLLPELLGGKVIISNDLLPFDYFRQARDLCYEQGNKAFEMLFLTPPSLVTKSGGKRRFSLLENFQQEGFNLWDGTSNDLTSSNFPTVNQHRVLQYDSCRGLEGWCVVCLGFDKLIEYRTSLYDKERDDIIKNFGLVTMDSEEAKKQFIGLWSLIPLTRAIDTLIITLSNPKSNIAEILTKCACEDYVLLLNNKQ